MLSTAWPWPYAPEGLPKLTVQMSRPDPFDPERRLRRRRGARCTPDGLVDKVYNLWNRNPIEVTQRLPRRRAARKTRRRRRTWRASEEEGRMMRARRAFATGARRPRRSPCGAGLARSRRAGADASRSRSSSATARPRPRSPADAPKTRENGQKIADDADGAVAARSNPDARLGRRGARRSTRSSSRPTTAALVGRGQGADLRPDHRARRADLEARDAERWPSTGSTVFHSGDELGSTIAVSCDMCHPDAANTHPETYPKFQAQLGRVALLRDMINWCIEHPVRGSRSPPTTRGCARSRPTSSPSARARRWTTASASARPIDYARLRLAARFACDLARGGPHSASPRLLSPPLVQVVEDVVADLAALCDAGRLVERPVDAEVDPTLAVLLLGL